MDGWKEQTNEGKLCVELDGLMREAMNMLKSNIVGGGMAVTDWETKGKEGGRSVNVREKRVGSRNPKVVEITRRWEPLTKGQEPGAQS